MSTKTILASTLLMILIGSGAVRAQGYAPPTPAAEATAESPAALSSYITYAQHDCCGPVGGSGPIGIELYVRSGPALPVAGGLIGDSLNTGWLAQAGGRSLFFNGDQTAAWTADLSISHIHNNGNRPDITFTDSRSGIPLPASVRDLNRTFATLAVGHEHWLGNPACEPGRHLRVGWDAGIRYGAARLDVNVPVVPPFTISGFDRFGSEAAAVVLGAQAAVEFPCGCCIWHFGARAEIDQSWTDFDGLENKAIWDMNFLLSLGVRY